MSEPRSSSSESRLERSPTFAADKPLCARRYPEIIAISDKVGATPAQVLIAWGQLGGHSVIPKSVTPSRIASNYEQITLSDEHVQEINKLGEKYHRFNIRELFGLVSAAPRLKFGADVYFDTSLRLPPSVGYQRLRREFGGWRHQPGQDRLSELSLRVTAGPAKTILVHRIVSFS